MAGLVPITPDEEEEEVKTHTLQITEPVLPSDYPLFSWDTWPNSFNALVPGGVTRNFEKACWNDIIGTLADAAAAAGFPFYDSENGFGEDDLLMFTGRFGRLTAARMNAVVAAFNNFLPWSWMWKFERDPPFPETSNGYPEGYWYRSIFWGIDDKYGREPHVVYPEYILGLAKRVNLFIELMRGTYPTFAFHDFSCISRMWSANPGVRAGRAARIYRGYIVNLLIGNSPVVHRRSAPVWVDHKSNSIIQPGLISATAGVINLYYEIGIPTKLIGAVGTRGILLPKSIRSKTTAKLLVNSGYPVQGSAPTLSKSNDQITIRTAPPTGFDLQLSFQSLTEASLGRLLLVNSESKFQLYSESQLSTVNAPSNPVKAYETFFSDTRVSASAAGLLNTVSKSKIFFSTEADAYAGKITESDEILQGSTTKLGLGAVLANSIRTETSKINRSTTSVELIKTRVKWVWPEHLSKSETRVETQLEESVSVEPKQPSKVIASATIAPKPPSGIESGQLSGVACRVSLDTAWLPPVWVDGGLWIRQAYSVVQNEDGSLEVT